MVGRGGFEPPKSLTADLQSAPFGRSGTCPLDIKFWSWWLESNPQPADYKSAALPVELHQQSKLGASGRNRTTDTGIFSPLLYRLSYRGIKSLFFMVNKQTIWRPETGSNRRPPAWQAGALTNWATGPNRLIKMFGGPSRTWTADQPVMSRSL